MNILPALLPLKNKSTCCSSLPPFQILFNLTTPSPTKSELPTS